MSIQLKKSIPLAVALTLSANHFVQANELAIPTHASDKVSDKASEKKSDYKRILMTKLSKLKFFTAHFSQQVLDETGEVIEESTGDIAISKPNLAYWQVLTPDELTIVSDGNNVWFYNPWIEQVSVYSLSAAISHTPILLLTSKDESLWQQYNVTQQEQSNVKNQESFIINAIDTNSQVRSLTLTFKASSQGGQLTEFSFLDATGQLSHIKLTDFNDQQPPNTDLFNFVIPEDTQLDDQRIKSKNN
ncbi:MAG: outer membrane lipoprotein chaperone LolA [Colwellia sp.]|nr:outer membrane lipoprotein chaperone LolA [Colwellia sp.]